MQTRLPIYGGGDNGDGESKALAYGGIFDRKSIFRGNPAIATLRNVVSDQDNIDLIIFLLSYQLSHVKLMEM